MQRDNRDAVSVFLTVLVALLLLNFTIIALAN
jgi:hypothetical protein